MILDNLSNSDRYASLHPRFPEAFHFLRSTPLASFAHGRHSIDGDDTFALISEQQGRTRDASFLEAHRRSIDIQLVLTGVDTMGWKTLSGCSAVRTPYRPEEDVEFFDDRPDVWVPVHPGAFVVFFPEDAHAPLVGDGRIHKVVVKVRL